MTPPPPTYLSYNWVILVGPKFVAAGSPNRSL